MVFCSFVRSLNFHVQSVFFWSVPLVSISSSHVCLVRSASASSSKWSILIQLLEGVSVCLIVLVAWGTTRRVRFTDFCRLTVADDFLPRALLAGSVVQFVSVHWLWSGISQRQGKLVNVVPRREGTQVWGIVLGMHQDLWQNFHSAFGMMTS